MCLSIRAASATLQGSLRCRRHTSPFQPFRNSSDRPARRRHVPKNLTWSRLCSAKSAGCGFHSTAPADISDGTIDGSVFRGRLEHGVWKRRNIRRRRLVMGRKRCSPGKARIRRQRRWDGWICRAHQGMYPAPVHAAPRITGREPSQNENYGYYDQLAHHALLARSALNLFAEPHQVDIAPRCVPFN